MQVLTLNPFHLDIPRDQHGYHEHIRTCMQGLHELEDDVIDSGRVLDGGDERDQLALDLSRIHALGGVQACKHGSVEMQQRRLHIKDFRRKAEPVRE